MQQNEPQVNQVPSEPKRRMGDFLKALLWTAIPLIILAIVGAVVTRTGSNDEYTGLMWIVLDWGVGGAFALGAIVASIVFGARHKGRITAGIFIGLAIGIIILGASCFASPGMLG
jgi:hypothetical protein